MGTGPQGQSPMWLAPTYQNGDRPAGPVPDAASANLLEWGQAPSAPVPLPYAATINQCAAVPPARREAVLVVVGCLSEVAVLPVVVLRPPSAPSDWALWLVWLRRAPSVMSLKGSVKLRMASWWVRM